MIHAQTYFLYGFTIGGFGSGVFQQCSPLEANQGWNFWSKAPTTMELYMKEVQFFKQFNVAWIFYWEYLLHQYLPAPYPLSLVRVYKIKWWREYKSKLCGKENVEHFCKTNTKKFTLHNVQNFEKQFKLAPATPTKKESPSSSTKSKAKGLSKKERDLLEYLKDDPNMRQIVLQKVLDKKGDSDDDETISSAASSSPKPGNPCFQDSQDPYE